MEAKQMDQNEKSKHEMRMKETKEAFEKLSKATCCWPKCGKKQMMNVSLPLMDPQPDGSLKPAGADKGLKSGVGMPVPFCDFHFHFAPFCAMVKHTDGSGKAGLLAPVDVVEVSKTTIAALVFSGDMDKLFKAKKEAEEVQSVEQKRKLGGR
jgi:hypothetical protein